MNVNEKPFKDLLLLPCLLAMTFDFGGGGREEGSASPRSVVAVLTPA